MGIFDILHNIKTWFTNVFGFKRSLKRKIVDCETVNNNKRSRLNHGFVTIYNESDTEEESIIEHGLGNVLLKANSPSMLDDVNHLKRIGTDKQLSSNMEFGLAKLQINNISTNDSNDEILPPSEAKVTPDSGLTSPFDVHNECDLNQSTHLSQISEHQLGENNTEIGESSLQNNDNGMFCNTLLKEYRETSATIALNSSEIHDNLPDDISQVELDKPNKLPLDAKHVISNYSKFMFKFVQQQMSLSPSSYILHYKHIKISDLRSVFNMKGWFNDEVINHYFNMIVERDPSIHLFNTFFYEQLKKYGYKSVSRWSKKLDIFAFKKMLIPLHLGNHWCVVCVDFVEKSIKYYDSLHGSNKGCLNTILNYLKEEHKNKKNVELDCSEWKLEEPYGPTQLNSYDCGAFACVTAEYLARDAELDFTQKDMPDLRLKICYEIFVNSLFYKTK